MKWLKPSAEFLGPHHAERESLYDLQESMGSDDLIIEVPDGLRLGRRPGGEVLSQKPLKRVFIVPDGHMNEQPSPRLENSYEFGDGLFGFLEMLEEIERDHEVYCSAVNGKSLGFGKTEAVVEPQYLILSGGNED